MTEALKPRRIYDSAMRLPVFVLSILMATPLAAQDWLTIYGYPELAGSDVVQISPVLSTWQGQVTFEVRATRQAVRVGYSGLPYRSYRGMAAVDCQTLKGWFLTLTFFDQPSWEGAPSGSANFKPGDAAMAFNGIPGEPSAKVINAACAAAR
ncbi:hypothetical protein [Xylophilus sp. GOD-11R]|uniref:hypothetical protein n=1 Tax=Xylophilus sp. GOD-11R TaxID=3089814 RepID=UPI00298BEA9E|nr:hypothetical protein [Xylophilus sp. GOD-11R]WPB58036.1 hypothetical protein R9X41_05185 [Xylophilus sp. GOD-11R]